MVQPNTRIMKLKGLFMDAQEGAGVKRSFPWMMPSSSSSFLNYSEKLPPQKPVPLHHAGRTVRTEAVEFALQEALPSIDE